MIPEQHAQRALISVAVYSRRQWRKDGYACDLSEYVDAGMLALLHCLERFDPTKGAQFQTYAETRIRWAILDTQTTYRAWHFRRGMYPCAPSTAQERRAELASRCATLPAVLQRYADAVWVGETDEAFSLQEGKSESWIANLCVNERRRQRGENLRARPRPRKETR